MLVSLVKSEKKSRTASYQEWLLELLRADLDRNSLALHDYRGRVMNAKAWNRETKSSSKINSMSLTALDSEAEIFQDKNETLEYTIEEIIGHCSVSARSRSNFARYVGEMVSGWSQALVLSVENTLKQSERLDTALF